MTIWSELKLIEMLRRCDWFGKTKEKPFQGFQSKASPLLSSEVKAVP